MIDTLKAKDCYDPAEHTLVHNKYLRELQTNDTAEQAKLRAKLAELEPKAAAFDSIVKYGLATMNEFDKWEVWAPLKPNTDEPHIIGRGADLLTAIAEVCGKLENAKK